MDTTAFVFKLINTLTGVLAVVILCGLFNHVSLKDARHMEFYLEAVNSGHARIVVEEDGKHVFEWLESPKDLNNEIDVLEARLALSDGFTDTLTNKAKDLEAQLESSQALVERQTKLIEDLRSRLFPVEDEIAEPPPVPVEPEGKDDAEPPKKKGFLKRIFGGK